MITSSMNGSWSKLKDRLHSIISSNRLKEVFHTYSHSSTKATVKKVTTYDTSYSEKAQDIGEI